MTLKKRIIQPIIFALLTTLISCGGPVETTGDAANDPTISILLVPGSSATSTSRRPGSSVYFGVSATNYSAIKCDFDGDGATDLNATETDSSFTHIYETSGTYSASCTAINSEGRSSISNYITIDVAYHVGDIVGTIDYPTGIQYISDVSYDKSTNTVAGLGFTSAVSSDPTIQIFDYKSGDLIDFIDIIAPPTFLNQSSELLRVGNSYYATSYGLQDGIPQAYIYKIYSDGTWIQAFDCPAAEADGYCEGLTWDGTNLWGGASDSNNLTQFTVSGVAIKSLAVAWEGAGIEDLTYDSTNDRFVVMRDTSGGTISNIDRLSDSILNEALISGIQNGDYDGTDWLYADNGSLKIKKVATGGQ